MKFGKELKERSVRGWEDNYMSYKRFKRIIKKLAVQLKEREELMDRNADDPDHPHPPSEEESRDWEEMILNRDARKEFFEEIDKEIERVNEFFVAQLDEFNEECDRLMEGGVGSGGDIRRQASSRSLLVPSSLSTTLPVPSTSFASRILAPLSSPLRLPDTPFLHRAITVSAQSMLEQRSDSILSLYRRYLNLLSFSFVNQQGFIKAMKKSAPHPSHRILSYPAHLTPITDAFPPLYLSCL
jgi:hypothetical protein